MIYGIIMSVKVVAAVLICTALPLSVSGSLINDFLVTHCLGGITTQYTVSVDCVKENIRGPLVSNSRHPDWRSRMETGFAKTVWPVGIEQMCYTSISSEVKSSDENNEPPRVEPG